MRLVGLLFLVAATCATVAVCDVSAQGVSGLDHLKATRQRPLFTVGRRPPPAPPAPSAPIATVGAPASMLPPDLQLSGVIIGPDRTLAIVKRPDARLVSLEVGREVDGWSVAAIRPRAVDLRRGDHVSTISLPPH